MLGVFWKVLGQGFKIRLNTMVQTDRRDFISIVRFFNFHLMNFPKK